MPLSFTELLDRLAAHHRLDLRGYKYTTLQRRTRRRMEQLRISEYGAYLDHLERTPGEARELLNTVLINVTKFYRDPLAWEIMRKEVMPLLLGHKKAGETFRVWCAGCSTGEEPYTVAMMVADYLGPTIDDLEIKIYASDQDEQALTVARKGEYSHAALNGLPQEWRQRYFKRGKEPVRVDADLRRLVIFGRSNIVMDAPISHVQLLVCRNLLIYFDAAAQRHIMNRLQYALEPEGVLFLGKAESQLRSNPYFVPLNIRWRIFQRTAVLSPLERPRLMTPDSHDAQRLHDRALQELGALRVYHNAVLETIEPGVIVLDMTDTVLGENAAVQRFWAIEGRMTGGKLSESSLARKCPELMARLEEGRGDNPRTVHLECSAPDEKRLSIVIRPIFAEGSHERLGTVIYMEDVSSSASLQSTIEELQTTAEELQSSNEELETTNEELQSTNEELETTNEELQSTNEELETTNEELKSLNEELEDLNEELNRRSRELDEVRQRYSALIESMPQPVLLISSGGKIQYYNTPAQQLFGITRPASDDGLTLEQLPVPPGQRRYLSRQYESVAGGKKNGISEDLELETNFATIPVSLHVRPLSPGGTGAGDIGILLLFEPKGQRAEKNVTKRSAVNKGSAGNSKKKSR